MRRLDRIREALQQLRPCGEDTATMDLRHHVSRSALMELMDCLAYVCFPECINPAAQVVPPYVKPSAMLEWVLGHAADIMTSQMYSAFVLHGDPNAVADLNVFKPVQTSQRSQLDWNAPASGSLSVVPERSQHDDAAAVAKDFTSTSSTEYRNAFLLLAGPSPDANDSNNSSRTFLERCKAKADAIVTRFLIERLSHVRWLLHTDVEAIFRNDVAATSPSEVVLCYPGIRCMLHQRVAHQLYLLGVPTNFTRLLTEIAHSLTGIDIHPNTSIGHHFFIDHGTGVVIGATALIGNHVSVYQGVTLGARSFPTDKKTGELIKNLPRHPILEDGVTVYANAVVLGRVTIGQGSTIGGNCWIVKDVPPFSSVVQKPTRMLAPHEKKFLHSNGSGI